jgi:hypothetical protein
MSQILKFKMMQKLAVFEVMSRVCKIHREAKDLSLRLYRYCTTQDPRPPDPRLDRAIDPECGGLHQKNKNKYEGCLFLQTLSLIK